MDAKGLSKRYEYDALLKTQTIPNHSIHLTQITSKRYPAAVYSLKIKDLFSDAVEYCVTQLMSGVTPTAAQVIVNTATKAISLINTNVNGHIVLGHNNELTVPSLQSLIVVKALASPKDIRECWVELMMRLALSGNYTLYLVLPIHNRVIQVSLPMNCLVDLSREMLIASNPVTIQCFIMMAMKYGIGSHVPLGEINRSTEKVAQIFLRSPQSGLQADPNPYISTEGRQLFVHALYCINICKVVDRNVLDYVANDLTLCSKLGGRGVVLHTGHNNIGNLVTALSNMEANVRYLLRFATESCPLLLETPCGEANEVCADVASMRVFFERFSVTEKKLLGLCVDTCHVFAAGYEPKRYISEWLTDAIVPIKLIHFNDSKTCRCSGKDEHEMAGCGLIGYERMHMVAKWGFKNDVPMLTE